MNRQRCSVQESPGAACATCNGTGLAVYETGSVYGGTIKKGCESCEAGRAIDKLVRERNDAQGKLRTLSSAARPFVEFMPQSRVVPAIQRLTAALDGTE